MTVQIFQLNTEQYRESWLEPVTESRDDGKIHVSSVINNILKDIDPIRYGRPPDVGMRWHWEMGVGWETVAMRQIRLQQPKLRFVPQVKLAKGGIIGTCDAVDNLERIWEFKFSRYSRKRLATDEEFRHYHWQMMAYCRMHGVDDSCLCICHLDQQSIAVRLVETHYTETQLKNNWAMLQRKAKQMRAEGRTK